MKKFLSLFLFLTTIFVGCQKTETDYNETSVKEMQTVTLYADMPSNDKTRAELSTYTGNFAWQTNDQINVLANDGKFYTLTLSEGAGSTSATFTGQIPDGASMTSVAMYPAIVADGTDNTIFDETSGTLNYTLPSEYTFVDRNTNVPMVAAIEDGNTTVSFKQIGGVIRFPINALPAQAKIVFTAKNLTTTGVFPIALSELGTAAIKASEDNSTNSTVTVNYSSEKAGVSADINIPVPTGTYENFSIEVFDANNESLVAKEYSLNKNIERATLLIMNAVDAGPMTISEVWPYFVDARVLFSKVSGAQGYAFYIDDNSQPIIRNGEFVDGTMQAVIGGDFEHGSTHTVAVAKVVNGIIDENSKSEAYTFTTGNVRQMTFTTGTKFVCASWDDVAIGPEYGTYFVNGKWNTVLEVEEKSTANLRGYRVQLYAEDKTTLLYDEIPFDGQWHGKNAFNTSNAWGVIGGKATLLPTSLSFGWLEPGKKYYFRVKTLDEPVVLNSENGNFKAEATISSARGGSAWSNLVEMTTETPYTMDDNDILFEGFDDMHYNSDLGNMSSAVIPMLMQSTDELYENVDSRKRMEDWMALDFSKRQFSEQDATGTYFVPYKLGLVDEEWTDTNTTAIRTFNDKAGSLKGWATRSTDAAADAWPGFGTVSLGHKLNSKSHTAELLTAPLNSDKLYSGRAVNCSVTIKAAIVAAGKYDHNSLKKLLTITQYRNDGISLGVVNQDAMIDITLDDNGNERQEFTDHISSLCTDKNNLARSIGWIEVKRTYNLKRGDIIGVSIINQDRGLILIDEIKIELDKSGTTEGDDRFWGTAPDNTNYDVWGMGGAMPITFWMGPPALDQFNAENTSETELANIKATYFDPIVEGGYNLIEICNPYPASMKVILDWCQAAGVRMIDKSIGDFSEANIPTNIARISNYASHAAYAGAFVGNDEPGARAFAGLDKVNDGYAAAFPTKGRTINLFPGYAKVHQYNCGNLTCDGIHNLVGNMEGYVKYFDQIVDVNNFMYDHYCLSKSDAKGNAKRGNVKSYQYSDLDLIRSVSLAKRKPFLQITHGRPAYDKGYSATIINTDPTWTTDISATAIPEKPNSEVYDEQRWLVWSQLALGSKGVSYFCYWTPNAFAGGPFSFHYDGTKTRMYDILKNINAEIKPIGQILMKCHADGAIMTNPSGFFSLYENKGMGLSNYGPVLGLNRANTEDVVAGCFRDATTGEYKVLVTHKAPATNDTEAATASIAKLTLDSDLVTKVKLHTVTLSAGHDAAASTVVSEVNVPDDGVLTLTIPDGTAVLVEFPETAGKQYN